jgi:tyrosyl-tRNA synthetase
MSESKNPMLMMAKYVIFPRNGGLHINRPDKYGGPIDFTDYESLKEAYFGCNLSPVDLKSGVADELVKTLEPVVSYFEAKPENYEAMVEVLKKLGKL